jgi:imidazolonepropionase-like amidohydrolase
VREHLFTRQPWVTPRDQGYARLAADAGRLQRAGGVLGVGSHGNYPGIGFHWEMQAHAAGGMTPHEVLRAATLGSAVAIGRAHELGSLEPGKLADFVVLSEDPLADLRGATAIRRVVQGGRLYDPQTLDETWPRPRRAPALWFQRDETR